jgi:small-conductance mechanosensitive channel
MLEELGLESPTHLAVVVAWLTGAVAGAYLLGMAVSWILRRIGGDKGLVKDLAVLTRRPFRVTLMLIAASIAVDGTIPAHVSWRGRVDHLLHVAIIAAVTWLFASLVRVGERRIIDRFAGGDSEMVDADMQRRRIRTQVTTVRRLVIAIIVLLGAAAVLMTFPSFKQIGTTLFASAGVLSVIAGLAAQTSLGLVFAGMQISFSNAIRVGDIVLVEDFWGRIEEITLTYVVVGSWDQRRLVLPTTYFTATPFENWTRHGTELLGTVELDVDFTIAFEPMRAELDRVLSESDDWDRRTGSLVVTDAVGGYLRVRATVSAANSGALWNLKCAVREGLVDWLQRTHPAALPRWRVEQPNAHGNGSGLVGAADNRGKAQ